MAVPGVCPSAPSHHHSSASSPYGRAELEVRVAQAVGLVLLAIGAAVFVAYVWVTAPDPSGPAPGDTPTLPTSSSTP